MKCKHDVSDACSSCYYGGGLCEHDEEGNFPCAITEKGKDVRIIEIGHSLIFKICNYLTF